MTGYLSGPMKGKPNNNHDTFNDAAKNLRELGFDIYNPAEAFGGDYEHVTKESFMRLDLSIVLQSDYLVVLPGFGSSEGAMMEVLVAQTIGVPVYFYENLIESGGYMEEPLYRYHMEQHSDLEDSWLEIRF